MPNPSHSAIPIICGPCWSDHCWRCEGRTDPPCACLDNRHGEPIPEANDPSTDPDAGQNRQVML